MDYDDEFPTCLKTYAALRIFCDELAPAAITALLNVAPSTAFAKGEPFGAKGLARKCNGWIFSTETAIDSKDSRRHLDWILAKISSKADQLAELRRKGAEIDISCYWLSIGQGGPLISPAQMIPLGELGIDVWWDVYIDASARTNAPSPRAD